MKKENKSKKDDAMTTKELISQLLALDPNLIIATITFTTIINLCEIT